MRDELAKLVHPVLSYGLQLKDRLERGESPRLEAEQSALIGLLRDEREARQVPDFGGDENLPPAMSEVAARPAFLGVRYALACWLDEIFILDSPWAERWNEYKLEVRLYGSNERAWKFWDQAHLAGGRSTVDALEAFYLCVMLGFSGELGEDAYGLTQWILAARQQLGQARARQWPVPPAREPVTRVPFLDGRRSLRTMLLVSAAAVMALIPAVALVLARRMG